MGKKKSRGQQALNGMEDEFNLPESVQGPADDYAKALRAANRAKAKLNSAKDAVIGAMRDADVERVRVNVEGQDKILHLVEEDKLKLEKPTEAPAPAAA